MSVELGWTKICWRVSGIKMDHDLLVCQWNENGPRSVGVSVELGWTKICWCVSGIRMDQDLLMHGWEHKISKSQQTQATGGKNCEKAGKLPRLCGDIIM